MKILNEQNNQFPAFLNSNKFKLSQDNKYKTLIIPNFGVFYFYSKSDNYIVKIDTNNIFLKNFKNKTLKYFISPNQNYPLIIFDASNNPDSSYRININKYLDNITIGALATTRTKSFYITKYYKFYKSGKLLETGEGSQRETKNIITYYENGKIEEKKNYYVSELNGKYESYYINGNLKEKGFYKPGAIEDGNWEFYHYNGTLWKKGKFTNGRKNGEWLINDNNKLHKINYVDDVAKSDIIINNEVVNLNNNNNNNNTTNNTVKKSKNLLRYYKCNNYPFKYGCINQKIKDIQIKLGVTPTKGYFGPRTLRSILKNGFTKVKIKGITEEIYNQIMNFRKKPVTQTVAPTQTVTPTQTVAPTQTVTPTQTVKPIEKEIKKFELPIGNLKMPEIPNNNQTPTNNEVPTNTETPVINKGKRIKNKNNRKTNNLIDKFDKNASQNFNKNLSENLKEEINIINEMFLKINKNYFR